MPNKVNLQLKQQQSETYLANFRNIIVNSAQVVVNYFFGDEKYEPVNISAVNESVSIKERNIVSLETIYNLAVKINNEASVDLKKSLVKFVDSALTLSKGEQALQWQHIMNNLATKQDKEILTAINNNILNNHNTENIKLLNDLVKNLKKEPLSSSKENIHISSQNLPYKTANNKKRTL